MALYSLLKMMKESGGRVRFCEIPEVVVADEVLDDASVVLVGIGMLRI